MLQQTCDPKIKTDMTNIRQGISSQASLYPKRRAASFSKGTTLPPGRLLTRQRSQTLPPLETQYVSRRALRSRLYMADDMSEIITRNMIPGQDTDGLRIPLQDWLNHPLLITDEQVARMISIELSTKSSPKLDSGSVAYFRSWPMEASQLSQIVDELRKSGPTTTVTVRYSYVREKIWTYEDVVKEDERRKYIISTANQAIARVGVDGFSPLAICGLEPPLESIKDGTHILDGMRASSGLLRSILTSMASLETDINDNSIKPLEDLVNFNQLLNWPDLNSDQKRRSRVLFDSWLGTIQPLVVVSFGQDVYAWLCQPSRRLSPPDSLIEEVGLPRVLEVPGIQCPMVIISHLHPGSYARRPTTASLDNLETGRKLERVEYFKVLRRAKDQYVAATKLDASAIMASRQLSSKMGVTVSETQIPTTFMISEDRKLVLDLHLSHKVISLEDVHPPNLTMGVTESRKRSRVTFEEEDHQENSRAKLKSNNWGPTNSTLERWRKVHDFIQKHEFLQSHPQWKDMVNNYKHLFAIASSVHRYTGGLIVGETPLYATHPPEWEHDRNHFFSEMSKCVKSFQNAVINSHIQRLPDFLVQRNWTAPSSLSQRSEALTVGDNTFSAQNQDQAHIVSSLFTTGSYSTHPPYRYKLALERCGQTRGPPDSPVRQQQAEALFSDGIASLCGWTSGEMAWVEYLQGLRQDTWIAASMEVGGPNHPQPERQKFMAAFIENSTGDQTGSGITLEEMLQTASQKFMVQQSHWLASHTRGKIGNSPLLDLQSIDGHDVEVSQRGQLRLKYKLGDGPIISRDIKLGPSIAPLERDDTRTIHFTELGIDLRTAAGFTLRVPVHNSECTLPLSVMGNRQNGQDFLSLWKAVRGETVSSPFPLSSSVFASEESRYPAELCLSPNGKQGSMPPTKRPGMIQPLGHNDALWLLKQFVDMRLPHGGDFWTGSKDDFPQGTDDVAGFIEYVLTLLSIF
ncbi:unnamed protein product [Fusarium equiseti]|uniref:Uncharacterized protein n=1 Tax=Fusarium equiseti TaxID=61235 RepID=A0A8J2IN18_FUSEQ|nr:unnamed protein product [Fusarium equiseti]